MTDRVTPFSTKNKVLPKNDGAWGTHIAHAVIGVGAVVTLAWLGVILWCLVKLAQLLL